MSVNLGKSILSKLLTIFVLKAIRIFMQIPLARSCYFFAPLFAPSDHFFATAGNLPCNAAPFGVHELSMEKIKVGAIRSLKQNVKQTNVNRRQPPGRDPGGYRKWQQN